MDEYIVELSYDPVYDCIESQDIVKEFIVRCRDCKYYDGEPDMESIGEKCWRDPDHTGHSTPTIADGYCWRGERREQ